jgi:hypothetical protein
VVVLLRLVLSLNQPINTGLTNDFISKLWWSVYFQKGLYMVIYFLGGYKILEETF